MLNRRTLRIKAMQTIFAYRQCREANYRIAIEDIQQVFSPDLNSMEVQDKQLLKKQSEEAVALFKTHYKTENPQVTEGSASKINEVVSDAISYYYRKNSEDFKFFRKNMVAEAERITDRYISMLQLPGEFAKWAENDQKATHENLLSNSVIRKLQTSDNIKRIALERNIHWDNQHNETRQWFKMSVKTNPEYLSYQKLISPSAEEDRDILKHIIKNIVFKDEEIDKYMEERDINWGEDRAIVKSLVTKTIKSIDTEGSEDIELQALSYNWEDDKAFFVSLFDDIIPVEKKYEALIAKKTKNWDIERIAITDKIILEMAISEMINFPSIPVKVTINEYIEVAKKYSTPKSKSFINGVLDVIVIALTESGIIKKSGRGLIDNK